MAVAWVLNLGYGAACLADDEPGATMRVAICQPAERIPGYYGRVAMTGVTHEVGVYRGLLEEAGIDGADLILWPESGVSEDLVASSFARGVVGDLAASMGAHIITGCHRQEGDRYYNSVVLVSPEGDVLGQYHKRHVVAFGEFLYFREQLMAIRALPHCPTRQARRRCIRRARARVDHLSITFRAGCGNASGWGRARKCTPTTVGSTADGAISTPGRRSSVPSSSESTWFERPPRPTQATWSPRAVATRTGRTISWATLGRMSI